MPSIELKFFKVLLGDLNSERVRKKSEADAWKNLRPEVDEVSELLYELQLKAHSESLDSYRATLRSFDGLLIFAGAMIAWLSKFIADLPDGVSASRVLAAFAVFFAGISVCFCFLGRRGIARPAHIGLPEALQALAKLKVAQAQDWLSRTMHVNRMVFKQVNNHVAKKLGVASWLICVAIVCAVAAVCMQP